MTITNLKTCVDYIRSQPERPPAVFVPYEVLLQIRDDLQDLTLVKNEPRPTYGPPYGNIDRQLWDEVQDLRKRVTKIRVLGVDLLPVP